MLQPKHGRTRWIVLRRLKPNRGFVGDEKDSSEWSGVKGCACIGLCSAAVWSKPSLSRHLPTYNSFLIWTLPWKPYLLKFNRWNRCFSQCPSTLQESWIIPAVSRSLPLFPFPTHFHRFPELSITATRSISPKHGDRGHLSPHVASHAAASAAQTRQSTVPTTTVKELAQAAKATMEVVQHQEIGIGLEKDVTRKKKRMQRGWTFSFSPDLDGAHCHFHPPPTTTCPHPPIHQRLPYLYHSVPIPTYPQPKLLYKLIPPALPDPCYASTFRTGPSCQRMRCHERWLPEKWNCVCSARQVFGAGGAFGASSRNEIAFLELVHQEIQMWNNVIYILDACLDMSRKTMLVLCEISFF